MEQNEIIDREDTICAISTPPGVGGIAVARISGPRAIEIVDSMWRGRTLAGVDTHTAHLGTVIAADGSMLDQCVATVYRSPRSFTGDDVVELAVHGSRFVQRELLNSLNAAGARLAGPGEFTRRAFAAGKMDLAEAEAVADVIASNSRASHRIAVNQMRGGFSQRLSLLRGQLIDLTALLELELDFSEEEVEFASRSRLLDIATDMHAEITRLYRSFSAGAAIKDGIPVALAGATNAGKSSLLNALLGEERAIVSDIHGTTRDTVEDTVEIGDYLFRFIDTAGLRDTSDTIEQLGIERSRHAISRARIVIAVVDATQNPETDILRTAAGVLHGNDIPGYLVVALNKCDIAGSSVPASVSTFVENLELRDNVRVITISAKDGTGIDILRHTLTELADADTGVAGEDILVTNARHAAALGEAARSTTRVIDGLRDGLPGDLVAQDLRETLHHLASITGAITTPDILATIFSRFCIGK